MIRRLTSIAVLLIAGFASPVEAAAPAGKASASDTTAASSAKASPAKPSYKPRTPRPATTASKPAAKSGTQAGTAAPTPGTTAPSTRAGASGSSKAEAAKRTLEDIHIEGEIPVPQVLFITTRDQRRFVGFQHRRYIRTSRKIGEETVAPSRIVVTGTETMPERSHSDE